MLIAAFLFLLAAAFAAVVSYLLYFHQLNSGFARSRTDRIAALGLPDGIAERRRRMASEKHEETFSAIKEAARLKVQGPTDSFFGAWYRTFGLHRTENRPHLQALTLTVFVSTFVFLFIAALVYGFEEAFSLSTVFLLLGMFAPLIVSKRLHEKFERDMGLSVAEVLRPLKLTLDRGFDLDTSLKELLTRSGLARHSNLVLQRFEQAVEMSQGGVPIHEALNQIAEETAVPRFTHLCHILSMSHQQGTGWLRHFEHLAEGLKDDVRLYRAQKIDVVERKMKDDPFTD